LSDFANGVEEVEARVLYAVQGRVAETLFGERTSVAAWQAKPCWYVVCRRDRTTSPELEHFLAERMGATTTEIDSGHLAMVTHPDEVANVVLAATQLALPRP
jgi:pimeloyl-ACP methyl ester carboxylesterase